MAPVIQVARVTKHCDGERCLKFAAMADVTAEAQHRRISLACPVPRYSCLDNSESRVGMAPGK